MSHRKSPTNPDQIKDVFYLTPSCIKESDELTPIQADALCLLSSFIRSGECDPGIPYVAKRIHWSYRATERAIQQLEQKTFLIIQKRTNKSSIYTYGNRFLELGWDVIINHFYKGTVVLTHSQGPPDSQSGNKKDIYKKDDKEKDIPLEYLSRCAGGVSGKPSGKPISQRDESAGEETLLSDYSDNAGALLLFWNDLGTPIKKTQIKKTKTFAEAMQSIQTKLSQGYSVDEIGTAMVRYHTLLASEGTKLNRQMPSHFVTLADFFGFNKFLKAQIKENNPVYGIKSWFDEAVQGERYLLDTYGAHMPDDDYPDVTEMIEKKWKATPYYVPPLTIRDKKNFRTCANELVAFLDHHERDLHISPNYFEYPRTFVKGYLFKALVSDVGNRLPLEITSGWLVNLIPRKLSLYLMKINVMKKSARMNNREEEDDGD